MSAKFVRAAFAAVLLCSASGAAMTTLAPQATAAERVSRAVGEPLSEAQKLMNAGDMQGALAKVKEAQAAPDHSAYDDYVINRFLAAVQAGLKNFREAAVAFDAAIASPEFAGQANADKAAVLHDAMIVSSNLQQWQKVVTYSQQLAPLQPLDDRMLAIAAIAYYNLKDAQHAQEFAQRSADAAKAASRPVDPAVSQILTQGLAQSNPAAAQQMLEQAVTQTNAPDDWRRLISLTMNTPGMEVVFALDLYRLMYLTRSLQADDAKTAGEYANLPAVKYYGDAVKFLQSIGGPTLAKAQANATKDKAIFNAAIAAAKRGSGADALTIAEGAYGFDRYAEAEELARAAAAKGRLKEAAEAQMLIGMSQVAQGKYADAVQTFNAIKGKPAAVKVAHLWSLYAQIKQTGGKT